MKSVEATYGVKLGDLEEARMLIEKKLNADAEARESTNLGGDYYKFEGPSGETLLLVSNEDLYDGETLADGTDGWKLILLLAGAPEASPFIVALEAMPDVIENLATQIFE